MIPATDLPRLGPLAWLTQLALVRALCKVRSEGTEAVIVDIPETMSPTRLVARYTKLKEASSNICLVHPLLATLKKRGVKGTHGR